MTGAENLLRGACKAAGACRRHSPAKAGGKAIQGRRRQARIMKEGGGGLGGRGQGGGREGGGGA